MPTARIIIWAPPPCEELRRDLVATEVKSDALLKGIDDGRRGATPALTQEQMQAALGACTVMTLGLVIQFGIHLVGFVSKRRAAA